MPTASNTERSPIALTGLCLFFLAWLADLAAIAFHQPKLIYAAKPLIATGLMIYCAGALSGVNNSFKAWMMAALFFSWGGDVLLMFESANASFFLFGLASFLLAHIFYCLLFFRLKAAAYIRSHFLIATVIALYYILLVSLLFPYLESMKIPVLVYGLVISLMLALALHLLYSKQKKAAALIAAGAVLFVISDSVLAFNKFYSPFQYAGVLIMFTYGLAQLFIATGFCRYLLLSSSATTERVS